MGFNSGFKGLSGWVGMIVVLDVMKTIISAPDNNQIPQIPVVQAIA